MDGEAPCGFISETQGIPIAPNSEQEIVGKTLAQILERDMKRYGEAMARIVKVGPPAMGTPTCSPKRSKDAGPSARVPLKTSSLPFASMIKSMRVETLIASPHMLLHMDGNCGRRQQDSTRHLIRYSDDQVF